MVGVNHLVGLFDETSRYFFLEVRSEVFLDQRILTICELHEG